MNKITLRKLSAIVTELISKYGADAEICIDSLRGGTPVLSIYNANSKFIKSLSNDDLELDMREILDIL